MTDSSVVVFRRSGLLPSLSQPYEQNVLKDDDYSCTLPPFKLLHCPHPEPQLAQMPLLRPQYSGRLFQNRLATHQRILPSQIRWASKTSSGEYQDRSAQPAPKSDASTSPAPTSGGSSMISQQGPGDAMVDHQLDYHAPIDHGTS